MAENTKGQNTERTERSNENDRSGKNVPLQNTSGEQESSENLDERSSTLGRTRKNTGISTKDGLTGSDYDGQVTDR